MQAKSIFIVLLAMATAVFVPSTYAAGKKAGNATAIANAGGPYSGSVGEVIQFDASASTTSGKSVSYEWRFGDKGFATGVSPIHIYSGGGSHTVELTILYNGEAVAKATTSAEIVGNATPVAKLKQAYKAVAGEALQFDGTASFDPDGEIVAYDWNFGDNTTDTGPTPIHSYEQARRGSYVVTLTVTDNEGASNMAATSAKITTGNLAPVADAGTPVDASVGSIITFDATNSYDSDGNVSTYNWDFGDGTSADTATTTHSYNSAGNYDVSVTVTDDAGTSGTDKTVATVMDGATPSIIRLKVPGQVKVDSSGKSTKSISMTTSLHGDDSGAEYCGQAHLQGSNHTVYQEPVCLSSGDKTTVSFAHDFGGDAEGTIEWTAWVMLDSGKKSQEMNKSSVVTIR